MRINSKGQITIPEAIREASGLVSGTEVDVVVDADGLRIVKASGARNLSRGQQVVERLRSAPGQLKLSADEILAMTRGDD